MKSPGPFACNMTALSSQQRARHRELGKSLRSSMIALRELPDGFEFEFPLSPSTFNSLAELTPLEHACCPFFDISIALGQDDKLFWRLTGNDGVKQFIRQEFDSWFGSQAL